MLLDDFLNCMDREGDGMYLANLLCDTLDDWNEHTIEEYERIEELNEELNDLENKEWARQNQLSAKRPPARDQKKKTYPLVLSISERVVSVWISRINQN